MISISCANSIPDLKYCTVYSGDSRLRRTHLDNLSFVSNIASSPRQQQALKILINLSFFVLIHYGTLYRLI